MIESDGKDAVAKLERAREAYRARVRRAMARETLLLASRIRKEKMTSGQPRPVPRMLGARSGALRASTRPGPVEETRSEITGSVQFGTKYAAVHIGHSGQVTTIRPVRRDWLTIPIRPEYGGIVLTKAGVSRGAARSGMWGETFVQRTKKGNLVIFGKRIAQKGASAGQARGEIKPLFVLKKEVKIKVRITVEELSAWFFSRFSKAMEEE